MNDIVIQADNLSKLYRLGVISTGTLYEDLNRWWAKVRGRPDPTIKIEEAAVDSRQLAVGGWQLAGKPLTVSANRNLR